MQNRRLDFLTNHYSCGVERDIAHILYAARDIMIACFEPH